MKISKNQLKTWNSQQSDIDMFSKLENNFLQKFFRLNLIDYFDSMLTNVYQSQINNGKKVQNKNNKALLNSLFKIKDSFMIESFESKIHSFYKHKSKSFQNGELQHVFNIRYCNLNPIKNYLEKDQLILFDVKIKAQIQKLQNIPIKNIQLVEQLCRSDIYQQDEIVMKNIFQNYKKEYFNLFIIYYGDINFHLIRKKNYQQHQTITIYNKKIKLRIFTFFISKQSLLETFRHINKIKTLDHINDLVIQFYQMKRQKRRQKSQKKIKEAEKQGKNQQNNHQNNIIEQICKKAQNYDFKYVAGGLGLVLTFGALFYKMYH